MIKIWSTAGA